MSSALAYLHESLPLTSEVSTTLSVSANVAYEVFADAAETPRWLPLVQTAKIMSRHDDGRPSRVAFSAKLDRGSVSYSLDYSYDPKALCVSWRNLTSSSMILSGEARFVHLSSRASLMLYRLDVDQPIGQWDEQSDGHLASAVVAEFREHLRRLC
jgi:uncharacterized membrane protein